MSIAKSLPHDSGLLHVTGAARYVDDLPLPASALHLAFGLSKVAHASITAMDLSAVRAAPDVVAVLTAEDLPFANDCSPSAHDEPLLATGEVHYLGQPIFLVIARTHLAARKAARLGEISYSERPALLTIEAALAAGSRFGPPVVWASGDVEAALAAAPLRFEGQLEVGGQEHFYLEGQAALALPGEEGDIHIISSTQHPTEIQHKVAEAIGKPMHAVRVECRRMGGGFGGKESQGNALAVASAVAARLTGQPCKMRYDRDDDMVITGKRHDFRIRYRVGHDAEGRLLAVDFTHYTRAGWALDLTHPVADRAMLHSDNAYAIPALRIESHRLRTNTQSATAFRGFGGPQGMIGIERVLDHLAHQVGRDPLEVRQLNFYQDRPPHSEPPHPAGEDITAPRAPSEPALSRGAEPESTPGQGVAAAGLSRAATAAAPFGGSSAPSPNTISASAEGLVERALSPRPSTSPSDASVSGASTSGAASDETTAASHRSPSPASQHTHYGQEVKDFVLHRLLDRLVTSADYHARRQAVAEWNAKNTILKRGIALTPVKFGISFTLTHLNQAGALVHVYADGSVHLNHGGTEMGQGLFRKVSQVAAEVFGLPLAAIRITATDTAKVPNTSATAASSGTDLNGMAVQIACQEIRNRMATHLAALHLTHPDKVRFEGGRIRAGAADLSFAEAANLCHMGRVQLSAAGFYKTPDIIWDRATGRGRPFFYFSYGAAISEVLVDRLTGENRILRADMLHDAGASLNPALDIGQVEGGYVQGAGWLTTEELVWDAKGALRTHAPSTYKIPAVSDRPEVFNVTLWDEPNPEATIYRSKAVGEPPFMLGISVLMALSQAVAACGDGSIYPALDGPATPERVLRAIHAQEVRTHV